MKHKIREWLACWLWLVTGFTIPALVVSVGIVNALPQISLSNYLKELEKAACVITASETTPTSALDAVEFSARLEVVCASTAGDVKESEE